MQHTDCAIRHFLGEGKREMLAAFLGCSPEQLDGRSPGDPHQGILADIKALEENAFIPASLSVTGLLYDVHSGQVEVVARRSPLRERQTA
jgi:hypothetical protein